MLLLAFGNWLLARVVLIEAQSSDEVHTTSLLLAHNISALAHYQMQAFANSQ
jgi:hypothetical protein